MYPTHYYGTKTKKTQEATTIHFDIVGIYGAHSVVGENPSTQVLDDYNTYIMYMLDNIFMKHSHGPLEKDEGMMVLAFSKSSASCDRIEFPNDPIDRILRASLMMSMIIFVQP